MVMVESCEVEVGRNVNFGVGCEVQFFFSRLVVS